MEDMDYYEYEESLKRFTPKKIIGFLFKLIAGIIIVGTFVLLIGRIQLAKIPKDFTKFYWSDAAKAALLEDGALSVEFQEPYSVYDDEGKYHVSNTALCRETGEVQLTVRYNSRSTINLLMESYALANRPSGESFVYILSDDAGNVYTDYKFAGRSRPLYEFRRLVFEGVDLSTASVLYLDVFYGEDVSEKSKMHATFSVYDKTFDSLVTDFDESDDFSLTLIDNPAFIVNLE